MRVLPQRWLMAGAVTALLVASGCRVGTPPVPGQQQVGGVATTQGDIFPWEAFKRPVHPYTHVIVIPADRLDDFWPKTRAGAPPVELDVQSFSFPKEVLISFGGTTALIAEDGTFVLDEPRPGPSLLCLGDELQDRVAVTGCAQGDLRVPSTIEVSLGMGHVNADF